MIRSVDEAQSDEVRPTDPDMNWTGWALHTLREAVEIDMRCKRLTERIRTGFLTRRDERTASGEEQRRRQRRERAAGMVAEATANPEHGRDVEHMRSMAWERLVEDEILDAQLDTLSAVEFVQEVCRKIGYPPDPIRLPQSWDETVEAKTPAAETEAADGEAADDWSAEPDESDAGRPLPQPWKPDSS
ncbi:hypothetical protein [Inquilinus sp. CA228]|uniref:hypothetical protein n=1 Tax=Inquilinus sp. CA228 TaxID=3455609 RepID=UPI003F8CFA30